MICAGINTSIEHRGFDLSVCHSVELPGVTWCLGYGLCSRPMIFGSFDDYFLFVRLFWCLRKLSDSVPMCSTDMT